MAIPSVSTPQTKISGLLEPQTSTKVVLELHATRAAIKKIMEKPHATTAVDERPQMSPACVEMVVAKACAMTGGDEKPQVSSGSLFGIRKRRITTSAASNTFIFQMVSNGSVGFASSYNDRPCFQTPSCGGLFDNDVQSTFAHTSIMP